MCMSSPLANQRPSFPEKSACLSLADGSTWGIAGADENASAIVSCLTDAMQLCPHDAPYYRILVLTEGTSAYTNPTCVDHRNQAPVPRTFLRSEADNTLTCLVSSMRTNDMLAGQLIRLSLLIAQQAQQRGGILLHGALIERDGWGAILAGPGRVGKTTASRRLPSSWCSSSDDTTLVVCDEKGTYWAHPWPTWSSFMSDGPGGTWDVNHAVPLKAIFFLQQAQQDRAEPVATGQSVCLLVELAEHTSWSMSHTQGKDVIRTLRLQRFENICSLVTTMPCYRLHLSLNGTFWEEIERVINEQDKGAL